MVASILRHFTFLGAFALALAPSGCLAAVRLAPNAIMDLATSKQAPELPPVAKQLRLTGTVQVEVYLSEDGTVEKVDVVRGNPILGNALQDSIKKWKFKPFKQGDTVDKAVGLLSIDFK